MSSVYINNFSLGVSQTDIKLSLMTPTNEVIDIFLSYQTFKALVSASKSALEELEVKVGDILTIEELTQRLKNDS